MFYSYSATPLLLCVLMQFRSPIMEGLALGKPCIAFDVGERCRAARQLRYARAPEDTDRFADAVRRTYQHGVGSLATQQARRQRYVQNFTPDAFGRHFAKAVAWWDARHKAS